MQPLPEIALECFAQVVELIRRPSVVLGLELDKTDGQDWILMFPNDSCLFVGPYSIP